MNVNKDEVPYKDILKYIYENKRYQVKSDKNKDNFKIPKIQ